MEDGPEDELLDDGRVVLAGTLLVVVVITLVVVVSRIVVLVVVVGKMKLLDKYEFVKETRFE